MTSKLQTVGKTNWKPNLKDCGVGVWILRPVVLGKVLKVATRTSLKASHRLLLRLFPPGGFGC